MADDEQTPNSGQNPFRKDLTYEELAALLKGQSVTNALAGSRERLDNAQEQSEVAKQTAVARKPNGVSTIKVTEVPDPFLHPKPESLRDQSVNEAAPDRFNMATSATSQTFDDPKNQEVIANLAASLSIAPDETTDEEETFEQIEADLDEDERRAEASQRMLRGSMWMTIGSMTSRILGAIYVIPWVAMIGNAYSTDANSLYAQGYQIYSVFLLIATAGLPNVLSRLVAEYQVRHEFKLIKQIFKQSLILGAIMGVVSGGVLFGLSGVLSQGHADVVPVLHALAAAIVIIPTLSMLRGYVQGFEFMEISALSQFIEQLVRVVYMLGMTYYIMVGGHGNWIDATVQSTFAAFWGALAAIVILIFGILKHRSFFAEQEVISGSAKIAGGILAKMFRQSLPIILAGSAVSLVQIIDQYTFYHILEHFTSLNYTTINHMFAQFSFNSNKLVMLVVSLAVAMAQTALPMLSKARAVADDYEIGHQVMYSFKLLAFMLIPAVLGMAAVAHPMYVIFYGTSDLTNGILTLEYASYTALVLGLYMVVLAIYQGLNELGYTLKMLVIILVIKLILQVPLTLYFVGLGPLMATFFSFGIGLIFGIRRLGRQYQIDWTSLNRTLMIVLFWALMMYLVVAPVVGTVNWFAPDTRLAQLIVAVIGGLIGLIIYGLATLKTHVAEAVLGEKVARLAAKLHL